ncbi:ATP-binding protein [Compostimonas suwonensis]|uniref:Signal transduction histidine kinase n=1 Tax=Compostimonas suwonensis TaxID=1048394 RepID=A0A2M9BCC3_9MICO|nr:ATP-binding protein [Compostimonas suwonensis]PJJ55597.1 signal transduction histidine kinase [Compostimonas suwonensis]
MVLTEPARPAVTVAGDSEFRVVRVLAASVGVGGVIFGLLALPSFVAQIDRVAPFTSVVTFSVVVGVPLALGLAARWASMGMLRGLAAAASISYLLAIVVWEIVRPGPLAGAETNPWLLSITAIPVACLAIARPGMLIWPYAIVVSFFAVTMRFQALGSTPNALLPSVQGALYILFFATLFGELTVVAQLGARRIDLELQNAWEESSTAAARIARQRERGRFEALIHDGIISTLLMAGRGGARPDPDVVAQAAQTAAQLETLRGATSRDEGAPVRLDELVTRLARLARGSTVPIAFSARVARRLREEVTVPRESASAIVDAAAEAVRNSLRHASPRGASVSRSIAVAYGERGLLVDVRDNGAGFDPPAVPAARLGIARSILGRMEAVPDGEATVTSRVGYGTLVTLRLGPGAEGDPGEGGGPGTAAGGAAERRAGAAAASDSYADLLQLSSVPARIMVALFVAVHAVLAFGSLAAGMSLWAVLLSFLAIAAAGVWATWPGPDPLPLSWSWAIVGVVFATTVLQTLQLQPGGWPEYATWHLGANTILLLTLELRGRIRLAWIGYSIMAATTIVWAVAVGLGGLVGLDLVIRHAGTLLVGTFFAIWIKRATATLRTVNAERMSRAGHEAATVASLQEREEQLRRLDRLALPLISTIARGQTLSAADRHRCLLLEATLRDGVRGRGLYVTELTDAAFAARERGVDVVLLDDGGGEGYDPLLVSAIVDTVVGELALLEGPGARLTARILPPGRSTFASVIVEARETRMIDVTQGGGILHTVL